MLGLKYIEGRYFPVRLILYQGQNEKGGEPGIVVTESNIEGSNAPTIITARGSHRDNRVYAMLGMDKPVEVRPRLKVEVTPCVERFFFQTYELRDELAEEVQDEVIEGIPWTAIPHQKGNITDEFDIDEDLSLHWQPTIKTPIIPPLAASGLKAPEIISLKAEPRLLIFKIIIVNALNT